MLKKKGTAFDIEEIKKDDDEFEVMQKRIAKENNLLHCNSCGKTSQNKNNSDTCPVCDTKRK